MLSSGDLRRAGVAGDENDIRREIGPVLVDPVLELEAALVSEPQIDERAVHPLGFEEVERAHLSVRQAAFIGVGAMVGAGIFALLGTAGEVAGAAVWVSFLLAGVVAGLQGSRLAGL